MHIYIVATQSNTTIMEEYFGLPYLCFYGSCLLLAVVVVAHVVLSGSGKKPSPRLPPGPWQLPVIGSVHHLLQGLPHHTIRDLSRRYGPLMLLRICERTAIVVSSAEAVAEMLKAHDAAFSERPSSPGIEELSRHGLGVIFAPYGAHWRLLRRILMTELLSARRVEAFRRIREDEAARLVSSLRSSSSSVPPGQQSAAPATVDMDERLEAFIADSSVRAVLGDRLPDRDAFMRMIKAGQDPSALFDLRDLFPSSWLVRMLPRSRKAERHRQEMFRLMDDILASHSQRRTGSSHDGGEQDMVDVLLRIQKEGDDMRVSLNDGVIRAALIDVLGAALDTSATTLQWAMAELMANPRVMQKAQQEIRRVMAGQPRVHEAALRDLHYLKAVIKETLRLHPPAPFVPRVCVQDDVSIQGYHVPQGAIVIVHVWAISRDPKYWEDPDMFVPERFQVQSLDYKGFDFEFTPFGAGRRMCPGVGFAHASVEIALASLLYHFDWKLPDGARPEEIDMTERMGITVTRKAKLLLHPIPWGSSSFGIE